MEITMGQLQELYNEGETNDSKYKRKHLSQWVEIKDNLFGTDFSYCDMIFTNKGKKYLVVIKKHHIESKDKNEKVECIKL